MSLRAIKPIADAPTPAADRGPIPEQRWLPIADLRVDDAYQRPITPGGRATIRTIVAEFDWRKFGPVVVCPIEGGLYAIVDGQHRTTGAATCGIEQVPCLVIQADLVQQARSFGAINAQVTKVNQFQKFRAAHAAGDPQAAAVLRVCAAAGVRLVLSKMMASVMKPGDTIALGAIRSAMARHGDATTVRAMKAIVASAGTCTGYLRAEIIAPMADVLNSHPEWCDDALLADALAGIDLHREWRNAKASGLLRRVPTTVVLAAAIEAHLGQAYQRIAA